MFIKNSTKVLLQVFIEPNHKATHSVQTRTTKHDYTPSFSSTFNKHLMPLYCENNQDFSNLRGNQSL